MKKKNEYVALIALYIGIYLWQDISLTSGLI